ncbi:hypothetical protein VDIAB_110620 [Vibrio diabolicus]|nr:hypothetical protein VDIAB_110620 [Vibrio diabolicus]
MHGFFVFYSRDLSLVLLNSLSFGVTDMPLDPTFSLRTSASQKSY